MYREQERLYSVQGAGELDSQQRGFTVYREQENWTAIREAVQCTGNRRTGQPAERLYSVQAAGETVQRVGETEQQQRAFTESRRDCTESRRN